MSIRSYKGRQLDPSRKVFAYRNLHDSVWSIKQLGLVVGHVDDAVIENATLVVSEAGRQRVIREGRKNVHAGVRGFLVDSRPISPTGRVTYNPFRKGHFYWVDSEKPIHEAQ